MELKADLWFPSIVFAGFNDDIPKTLKLLQKHGKRLKNELAGNSNEGGWHSRSIEKVDPVIPACFTFNKLLIELDKVDYCSRVQVKLVFPKICGLILNPVLILLHNSKMEC